MCLAESDLECMHGVSKEAHMVEDELMAVCKFKDDESPVWLDALPGSLSLPWPSKGGPTPASGRPDSKRGLDSPLAAGSPKRPHLSERASLRGVTSGTRPSGQLTPSGTCWIFVDGTNWDVLLSLLSQGLLDVLRVFVRDGDPEVITNLETLVGNPNIPVTGWDPVAATGFTPCHISLVGYRVNGLFLD